MKRLLIVAVLFTGMFAFSSPAEAGHGLFGIRGRVAARRQARGAWYPGKLLSGNGPRGLRSCGPGGCSR